MKLLRPLILLVFIGTTACKEASKPGQLYTLFVGTYTDGNSQGIYAYTFDSGTGLLSQKQLAAPMVNPSFLKRSTDFKKLYVVQESDNYDSLGGAVTAFKVKHKELGLINTVGSMGAHPCHIALSADDSKLAVSNYTGGNVTVYDLDEKGWIKESPQVLDHKMLDLVKTSHAHAAEFVGNELFVADLGLDALKRYVIADSIIKPHTQASLDMAAKAGPRHFTFSKDKQFLYIINELNSTITVMKKHTDGSFKTLETVSTLDQDFSGESYCADIHLSSDGRFLYGSNRGENTIVLFAIEEDGTLKLVNRTPVMGNWPRNFSLDPTEQFVLVANQKSDNITVFERDSISGKLNYLHETPLSKPVCIAF